MKGFIDRLKGDGLRAVTGVAAEVVRTAVDKATTLKEEHIDGPDNFADALDGLVQKWRAKGTSDVAVIRVLTVKARTMAEEGVTL